MILGFSFAFATERFEARRALVVSEAVAIGSVNMKAAFLPAAQQAPFRQLLVAYTRSRLETYAETASDAAESRSAARSKALYGRLWSIVSQTALRDVRNQLTAELTTAVDEGKQGFIRLETAPLQATLDDLKH